MFYEEGDSLNLDLFVQSFEDARERYWADADQGRNYMRQVDRIARILLQGSSELVEPPKDFGDPKAIYA